MANLWPNVRADGWYSRKSYNHFDKSLPFHLASSYVKQKENITKHQFLPFLSFEQVHRRYRTEKIKTTAPDGKIITEKRRLPVDPKVRPLKMTSHIDGYVFAYYAKLLNLKYETLITKLGISDHVIAYRKGLGTNIDFAKAAFDEVVSRENCVAVTMDIRSFFDSIDHHNLKTQWARLLGLSKLPDDHFSVFKAMTKYSWVDRVACCERLNIKLDDLSAGQQICSVSDFRDVIRGSKPSLVKQHTQSYGIPQGSPLSAILSNVFMIAFDEHMSALCAKHNWYYLRYSDDILVIGEPNEALLVSETVGKLIRSLGESLDVNTDKTEVFKFKKTFKRIEIERQPGSTSRKNFQYLGFTFDGEKILIRPGTLSNYSRKAMRSVRRAKGRARRRSKLGGKAAIYKRKLYEEATHLGKRNFFTYVRRAQKVMDKEPIRQQVSGHFRRIQLALKS